MAIIASLRILTGLISLVVSYEKAEVRPEFNFNLHHPNGEKKSREELEMEALEEPFWPWFKRFAKRPAWSCEVFCGITQLLAIVKCLNRLNVEVGRYEDAKPSHPMFWVAVAISSLLSVVELSYVDSISQRAAEYGKQRLENSQTTFSRRIGSSLSIPLLAEDQSESVTDAQDPEQPSQDTTTADPTLEVGVSDISSEAKYKAGWSDLLYVIRPDLHFVGVAFLFLLLAAVAQVYIPRFTGQILDSLAETFAPDKNNDDDDGKSIFDVPGFVSGVKKLGKYCIACTIYICRMVMSSLLNYDDRVLTISPAPMLLLVVVASILCGFFSGIRGSIFTVVRKIHETRLFCCTWHFS